METSQETPCIAILNKQKCHFSKTRSCLGVGTSVRKEDVRKGFRMNVVGILCTHVCKWKNETCSNIPGMWGGENKGK
jgi:hypothetical protein